MASIFPWSGILCFLLVMPFSYMPWEKYALPLLLFMVLALCRDSSAILLEDPAHGSRSAAIGSMRDARRAGR